MVQLTPPTSSSRILTDLDDPVLSVDVKNIAQIGHHGDTYSVGFAATTDFLTSASTSIHQILPSLLAVDHLRANFEYHE